VSVLLGTGGGSFAPAVEVQVGSFTFPNGLAAGDLDADGDVDLVASLFTLNRIALLVNQGDGTFVSSLQSTFTSGRSGAVALGDLDADGDLEVVIAILDDRIRILTNNGAGTFAPGPAFAPGYRTEALALADLDGDGRLDIAGTSVSPERVHVLLNRGSLNFTEPQEFAAARQSRGVFAGDVDGDGRPDLAWGHQSGLQLLMSRDVPFCDTPRGYCTANTNAFGCTPQVASTGASSASSSSGFLLQATGMRNHKPGWLLYTAAGRAAFPFSGGTLCLQGPVTRSKRLASGGTPRPTKDCSGVLAIDMNAFGSGAAGGSPESFLTVPGTFVQCQFWGYDPRFPVIGGAQLSDALEFQVGL
jgi:hypothetical protein